MCHCQRPITRVYISYFTTSPGWYQQLSLLICLLSVSHSIRRNRCRLPKKMLLVKRVLLLYFIWINGPEHNWKKPSDGIFLQLCLKPNFFLQNFTSVCSLVILLQFLLWQSTLHCSACITMLSSVLFSIQSNPIYLNQATRPIQPVPFLQHVSIACYAERCISYSKSVRPSVCLSDRLSVTRWHCVKTTPATIMGSSLEDSPMTLVSTTLDYTAKFQMEHG